MELIELLILFKNKLKAKERSLSSGHNFKEKQDKIDKFLTSNLISGSGSAKLNKRCKNSKAVYISKSLCYICLSPKQGGEL